MNTKERLNQWLANGETERVVEALQRIARDWGDRYFSDDVTNVSGRFNTLQNERHKGLVNDYQDQLNAIRPALQALIAKVPDGLENQSVQGNTSPKIIEIIPNRLPEGKVEIPLDPTPARATGKAPVATDPLLNDSILEEIKHPCIRSIEKNLRMMANSYFDENGFERPPVPGSFFTQSYLTLQGIALGNIEAALRAMKPESTDFFEQAKNLSKELKARCAQVSELLDKSGCVDFPLRMSIQNTMLVQDLSEKALRKLITDSSTATQDETKSGYLIPLANQLRQLSREMTRFDSGKIKAIKN